MPYRHLQRPGDAGPEGERGEERGRQVEVVLDEELADDPGEALDAERRVDEQRREIRDPEGFQGLMYAVLTVV
jgi:hypothetical protein